MQSAADVASFGRPQLHNCINKYIIKTQQYKIFCQVKIIRKALKVKVHANYVNSMKMA